MSNRPSFIDEAVLHHDYRAGHFSDLSGNANDGTPTATVWQGGGVKFPEITSKIVVSDSPELSLNEGTVVAFGDLKPPDSFQHILNKNQVGVTHFAWYIWATGVSIQTGTDSTLAIDLTGKSYLATNFKDAEQPITYLDGVLHGTHSAVTAITADSEPLNIGAFYTSAANLRSEALGAILIFPRKLTATEHAELFAYLSNLQWPSIVDARSDASLTIDPDETGLAGAWNMRPESGVLVDVSANGNDGTIDQGVSHSHTLLGDSMVLESGKKIDCGNVGNLKTVSFWASLETTTEELLKLSASHSIEAAAGTLTATGFTAPTIYVDGVATTTITALVKHMITVTTDTTVAASAFEMGGPTPALAGSIIGTVKALDYNPGTDWIDAEYAKGQDAGWHTDFGVHESVAAVASGFLENSPFVVDSGSFKISSEEIDGELCKVIECVTTGICYVPTSLFGQTPTEAAFGEWQFWVNKTGAATETRILFVSDVVGGETAAGQDGYSFQINGAERLAVLEMTAGGLSNKYLSDVSEVSTATWYRFTITRTSEGVCSLYTNGVLAGNAIDGSNPFTDTTVVDSKYLILELDAGDKIAYSDIVGGHSIQKRPIA